MKTASDILRLNRVVRKCLLTYLLTRSFSLSFKESAIFPRNKLYSQLKIYRDIRYKVMGIYIYIFKNKINFWVSIPCTSMKFNIYVIYIVRAWCCWNWWVSFLFSYSEETIKVNVFFFIITLYGNTEIV